LCSFAAIYVWYLPAAYHVHFWYLIPFFHSLQYLLFVVTLKRNQCRAEALAASIEPQRQRAHYARNLLAFGGLTVLAAALCFDWLPHYLDRAVSYDHALWGKELFMFAFVVFINVHHYFIDNVIWRRDNPLLKRYL
jgi:hypothetical protein